MTALLVVIDVLVALALIGLVLLQRLGRAIGHVRWWVRFPSSGVNCDQRNLDRITIILALVFTLLPWRLR